MNLDSIKRDFKHRVSDQIDLLPEGDDRFLVTTPFRFDDGDHFSIILKSENGEWILSDEATTLMHLSYDSDDQDLTTGNRGEIVEHCLEGFDIRNREGELITTVTEGRFGDALFNFLQGLTKVSDISFLARERVRSTFIEDFRTFMRANVPEDRLSFDWTDQKHDKAKKYPVDARINHMEKPLFVYALQSDEKVKDATISLLTFEKWDIRFRSLAIFEDQVSVARNTLAKFMDVNGKAFSSLEDNKARIMAYLKSALSNE
jgi:hypothetical protein